MSNIENELDCSHWQVIAWQETQKVNLAELQKEYKDKMRKFRKLGTVDNYSAPIAVLIGWLAISLMGVQLDLENLGIYLVTAVAAVFLSLIFGVKIIQPQQNATNKRIEHLNQILGQFSRDVTTARDLTNANWLGRPFEAGDLKAKLHESAMKVIISKDAYESIFDRKSELIGNIELTMSLCSAALKAYSQFEELHRIYQKFSDEVESKEFHLSKARKEWCRKG